MKRILAILAVAGLFGTGLAMEAMPAPTTRLSRTATTSAASQPAAPIKLDLVLVRSERDTGPEFRLRITNVSGQPVGLFVFLFHPRLCMGVLDEDGKPEAKMFPPEPPDLSKVRPAVLVPGQGVVFEFPLAGVVAPPFWRKQTYRAICTYETHEEYRAKGFWVGKVVSNEVRFTLDGPSTLGGVWFWPE